MVPAAFGLRSPSIHRLYPSSASTPAEVLFLAGGSFALKVFHQSRPAIVSANHALRASRLQVVAGRRIQADHSSFEPKTTNLGSEMKRLPVALAIRSQDAEYLASGSPSRLSFQPLSQVAQMPISTEGAQRTTSARNRQTPSKLPRYCLQVKLRLVRARFAPSGTGCPTTCKWAGSSICSAIVDSSEVSRSVVKDPPLRPGSCQPELPRNLPKGLDSPTIPAYN